MMGKPEYIELNMNNYNEDDVSQLNDWGVWASSEIDRLQSDSDFLNALRNAGVDNWEGYSYACETLQEDD